MAICGASNGRALLRDGITVVAVSDSRRIWTRTQMWIVDHCSCAVFEPHPGERWAARRPQCFKHSSWAHQPCHQVPGDWIPIQCSLLYPVPNRPLSAWHTAHHLSCTPSAQYPSHPNNTPHFDWPCLFSPPVRHSANCVQQQPRKTFFPAVFLGGPVS